MTRNKYQALCIECEQHVKPGAGELRRSKRGRYYVLCKDHGKTAKFEYTNGRVVKAITNAGKDT